MKQQTVVAAPAVGQEFELTLETVDPLEMVRRDGYNPKGWRYEGPTLTAPLTRRFKLENLGYCRDRGEASRKAKGKLAHGQWREAFKAAFPMSAGSPVAFGGEDSKWLDPVGSVSLPVLYDDGVGWFSDFRWADFDFHARWLWLGECDGA